MEAEAEGLEGAADAGGDGFVVAAVQLGELAETHAVVEQDVLVVLAGLFLQFHGASELGVRRPISPAVEAEEGAFFAHGAEDFLDRVGEACAVFGGIGQIEAEGGGLVGAGRGVGGVFQHVLPEHGELRRAAAAEDVGAPEEGFFGAGELPRGGGVFGVHGVLPWLMGENCWDFVQLPVVLWGVGKVLCLRGLDY